MSRIVLMPGTHFGKLTVIAEAEKRNGRRHIKCQCDCGNETIVSLGHLRSGHTKSCGCMSPNAKIQSIESLRGQRFGRLTVVDEAEKTRGVRRMLCLCDCGNKITTELSHLKNGHTQSCGCLRMDKFKSNAKDIAGQRFGRLVAVEPTDKRFKTSVVWRCICDCGKETYVECEDLTNGQTKSCGCLREDTRKENMKKAIHFVDGTCVEKIAVQREIASNTSGHRGVTKRPNGTWRAEITFRGKRYHLGTHKTFEEAVQARLKGEQMYIEFLEEYYTQQNLCAD